MYLIYIIINFFLIFFGNLFFKKKKLINNFNGSNHQKFSNKDDIPLSGGTFFILLLSPILIEIQSTFFIFIFLFYVLGLLADIKFVNSTSIRIIIQLLLLIIFSKQLMIEIDETRFIYLDYFLQTEFFNLIFVIFCFMVLLNGCNFIDGLNGLVIVYFSLILIMLHIFQLNFNLEKMQILILFSLILLICLGIFNFLNQLFLGDSGSYAFSIFFGYFLIKVHNFNPEISPFFFVTLLWYPGFELLFSIIRKFILNKSPFYPDTNHLHHLLYNFLKKKFKLKKLVSNNLSSILINTFNLLIFILAFKNLYITQFQIFLIIISIASYIVIYFKLFQFKLRK